MVASSQLCERRRLELLVVPEDALAVLGLDVDALPGLAPGRLGNRGRVEVVVVPEDGPDRLGGLHGVVVRHGGEEVVRDVRVRDVVEHAVEDAVVAVHGGQRAAQPVPLARVVVGERRVGVLQVGDEHQPRVHDQQRHGVHAHHPPDPERRRQLVQPERHGHDAGVRDEDLGALPVVVDGAVGVEVAGEARVRPPRRVGRQVQRPPEGELHHDVHHPADRVVVHVRGVPRQRLLLLGHEHLVALQGPRVGVVAPVAVLPREVGHHERRVQHQADHVVQERVVREGVVAALVRDDPHAGAHAPLRDPVQRPGGVAERAWERRYDGQREVEERRGDHQVVDHVREGLEHRALEAVWRDGLLDLTQSERRLLHRRPLHRGATGSSGELLLLLPLLLGHPAAGTHLAPD
uniref:Uncharacterized protein n=1 Tax=Zea mays TaxID=4577 RepID=B7ZYI4_MAIZE|nr:unknown [Zea mays]ACL53151.1 unknown [Zea mays]ACL53170.1 unknown [Zea mays]ACL53198.1 unknown [Zea mays]ACN35830.1 unknown [Zea mays]